MEPDNQLKLARELVEVLEQLEATASSLQTLHERHSDLLRRLAATAGGQAAQDTPDAPAAPSESEPPADPVKEALAAYDAAVEKASAAQKRMIFGMLGNDFKIVSDADMKAIIIGICAELHYGVRLESIGKELSKAWATDVIDYLKKAKPADLKKFLAKSEPF